MTQPIRESLALTLQNARASKGYTVRRLAAKVKRRDGQAIGGSYITDLEKQRAVPSDHVAEQLARILGLDPGEFLDLCERARRDR